MNANEVLDMLKESKSDVEWIMEKVNGNLKINPERLSTVNILVGDRLFDNGLVIGYPKSKNSLVDLSLTAQWYCRNLREPVKDDFEKIAKSGNQESFEPIKK